MFIRNQKIISHYDSVEESSFVVRFSVGNRRLEDSKSAVVTKGQSSTEVVNQPVVQPSSMPTQVYVAPSVPESQIDKNDLISSDSPSQLLTSLISPSFSPTSTELLAELINNKETYDFNREIKMENAIAYDDDMILGVICVFVSVILLIILRK
jgi:F0F1-type ATP synthase alpha subunit